MISLVGPCPMARGVVVPGRRDVLRGLSTTLDWVHGLQPEDLEKFLTEKKEQRMRVLCLDLEPTGIPQQVGREPRGRVVGAACPRCVLASDGM